VTRLLKVVQGCAAVLLAVLLVLAVVGGWPVWPSFLAVAILLACVLFERFRYKPIADRPPPGWQATGERFIDPETGTPVIVFYDPTSGERQYVKE
jgi:hypothetical protein